ncbi:cytochrome ubiquinol oxidase subunit I [Neoroseomonas lacus]|uniref:Cytochrome ubiquinol oxidase subunit I n=1 Tax=Neoroseomonas lacus TaxID=287609 RepID=A0A917KK23_9PROT|nr:cytochrome ubiquinol oxidase subunit I [Neoroseomonas lacus]GGJ17235.1 cytochrome ubiquinol oxidase subunit I [Neoroseomonas lacus]
MDALILSRLQFAATIGFHILWPTFSIGTAAFVAFLSFRWWRTGNPVFRDLMRFWSRLFGLSFAMGVVTGLVLSYEMGTNWAGFSQSTGRVLGPLFAYEVLVAFFLEAGFIGIVLFGEGRISRGAHLIACCIVAFGTLLSAALVLAANSWMQTPGGVVRDADGIFHVTDWLAVILTPSYPYRVMHMLGASFLTVSFLVAGVSAIQLLREPGQAAARKAFSLALWAALILAPLQIVLGDMHGLNTRQYQPTKLAAMEGLWESGRGVPATLFAWPDMDAERNRFAVEIPRLGSLYLTHSWNGEVRGLRAVPREDRPYVPIVFFAFRIMAGIGILLLTVAITGAILRLRGRLFASRRFQWLTIAVSPLGFVAVIAGWTVTEAGRQPWVVYGLLRTADAVSPVPSAAVATSLLLFLLLYAALLVVFIGFATRLILRGVATSRTTDLDRRSEAHG